MPKPKHHLNEPVQTADGQELDEEEILENAEEEIETNPDEAEDELEQIDSDLEDVEL